MTDYTDAQMALIEKHRDFNVHDTWYEYTIDQFVEACGQLKLDTSTENVQFSGFCSQGDGASFTFTSYGMNAVLDGCVEFLAAHERPEDASGYMYALWSFATDVVATFDKYRLLGGYFMDEVLGGVSIEAKRTGYHYCHAKTVTAGFDYNHDRADDDAATEHGLHEELSGFGIDGMIESIADGLYHDLEAEYDYLTSDDAVWEALEANGIEVEVEDEEEDEEEEECVAD